MEGTFDARLLNQEGKVHLSTPKAGFNPVYSRFSNPLSAHFSLSAAGARGYFRIITSHDLFILGEYDLNVNRMGIMRR